MQREIKDLRRLLESELAHISWNDKRLREPLRARVLEDLSSMDIAPDVAASACNARTRGAPIWATRPTFPWRCCSSICRWSIS